MPGLLTSTFAPITQASYDGYGLGNSPYQSSSVKPYTLEAVRARYSNKKLDWFSTYWKYDADKNYTQMDSAGMQFNTNGTRYYWFAIGTE